MSYKSNYFVNNRNVIVFSANDDEELQTRQYIIEFLKLEYYKISGISRFCKSIKIVKDVEKNVASFKLKKISEGYRELSEKAFQEYAQVIKENSKI